MKRHHRGRFTVLLLLAVAAGAAASKPLATDERTPGVSSYRGTLNCRFDRILAGASDFALAVWINDKRSILGTNRVPPNEIIVGRMHDSDRAASDRLFAYSGEGLRLFPVRWSSGGKDLFVRIHEQDQRLITVDADGGAPAAVGTLNAAWGRVSLVPASHGDASFLRDPGVLRKIVKIDGKALIRGAATVGDGIELLGVRHPDLELVRVSSSGISQLGVNAGQTRLLTIFGDGRDYKSGISYLGAPMFRGGGYLPYQQPLIDQATGRVNGRFGLTGISLENPGELSAGLAELNADLHRRGAALVDASRSGDVVVAITLEQNGDRRLVRLSPGGLREKPLCAPAFPARGRSAPSPPYPLTSGAEAGVLQMRVFTLNPQGGEAMEPGRPVVLQYSLGEGTEREAVVYFHGGPGATIADELHPVVVKRFLKSGRDVVAVEYSGSLGGGLTLSRRLAWNGMSAIDEDVDAVSHWLKRRGYARVYVVGNSFGGVPALAMLARHRQQVTAGFFLAPLLQLQDPEEWAKRGSGLAPVATDTQLAYEHAYLGGPKGRAEFARDLRLLLAKAELRPSDQFYFAEFDPMSRPEHLPSGVLAHQKVVPRAVHGAIASSDTVWEGILSSELLGPLGMPSPVQQKEKDRVGSRGEATPQGAAGVAVRD